MRLQLAVVSVLWFAIVAGTWGADWGDLKVRFVLEGEIPQLAPIVPRGGACAMANLRNEQLIVDPKNKGIANVCMYLRVERDGKGPPVHESYKQTENADVESIHSECRFEPHILAMRTGQTLVIGNRDPYAHNTNFPALTRNQYVNRLVLAFDKKALIFQSDEPRPAQVQCNIHPYELGWLIIQDHPYVSISDADGNVAMKNVPSGKWTFQLWQESAGYVSTIQRHGKEEKLPRGRIELDIPAGGTRDLGEVKMPASIFKLK